MPPVAPERVPVTPPGTDVTTNSEIGLPPLFAGATKVTSAVVWVGLLAVGVSTLPGAVVMLAVKFTPLKQLFADAQLFHPACEFVRTFREANT